MTTVAAPPKTTSAHIHELESEQARIQSLIANIHKELDNIQQFRYPISLPDWVNPVPATRIEDLLGPPRPSHRNALLEDLRKLQEQAKTLQAELETARRKRHAPPVKPHPAAAHRVIYGRQRHAEVASQAVPKPTEVPPNPEMVRLRTAAEDSLTKTIKELQEYPDLVNVEHVLKSMRQVKSSGGDPERGRDAIRHACEGLLTKGIKDLDGSPSIGNMHNVIEIIKALAESGGDQAPGWEALGRATTKNANFAVAILRSEGKDPNIPIARKKRNLAMVWMIAREASLLGNGAAAELATEAVKNGAGALHEDSERQFRNAPTSSNFAERLTIMHGAALLGSVDSGTSRLENPPGVPILPGGIVHHVVSGDTLNKISVKYFHDSKWWDVIVFRNPDQFRDLPDPNKALTMAHLKIS